jgi:gliding motility-associated-like protein
MTHIWQLDASANPVTGSGVALSSNIPYNYGSFIAAGSDFVLVRSGSTMYKVVPSTGTVTTIGTSVSNFTYYGTENWASWGYAEYNGTNHLITYRANDGLIRKYNVETNTSTVVFDGSPTSNYSIWSDMGCITYAPWNNRFYFHYEGSSSFISGNYTNEAAGYCSAPISWSNSCNSEIDTVIVTFNALPTITGTQGAANCGPGAVALSATPSAGTIIWYASQFGGIALDTGLTFNTPILSSTTTYFVAGLNNGCVSTSRTPVTATINIVPNINASSTNVLCYGANNGTASVSVLSGASPFTFSWNTTPAQTTSSISNLAPGTYVVTVTSATNCISTDTVVITEPAAPLAATTTQVNVLCFGNATGSATVTATGGTGTKTYSWNTTPVQTTATATGLAAGTYTVTVTDANACTTTQTVTITQPAAPLTATTTQVDVLCFGDATGSAAVIATGGTGTKSYSWNTTPVQTTATATGLAAGTYTVTVTDVNACTTTQTVTITQPAAPLTATTTQVDVLCFGNATGSATVTATGGTGTKTYSWNTTPVQTTTTATGLAAGTYTVTVTDANACTTTQTVTITQPAAPLTATTTQVDVLCFGDATGSANVVPAGGTGTTTYSWNTVPAQTTATATGLTAGTYSVTVTDANGCSTVETVTITEPTALLATGNALDSASCLSINDGSAFVTPTGGVGPYSYAWSNGETTDTAFALSFGTASVVVSDANGCSYTLSGIFIGTIDADCDGIPNSVEGTSVDTDGDGVPNYKDTDSDNDGIPDDIERGPDGMNPIDTDGDGARDYVDLDSDGDGIPDEIERGPNGNNPLDTDGDGTPDYRDTDSDNDGDLDADEWDYDGDGIGGDDCDEDGVPNYLDEDACVLTIPSGFSPDGDGANDTFKMLGLSRYRDNQLQIFNRQGQLVYEKENYNNEFDGTPNRGVRWSSTSSNLLPSGTYFYVFKTYLDQQVHTGYVFIAY